MNSKEEDEHDDCCDASVIVDDNQCGIGTTSPTSSLNSNTSDVPRNEIHIRRPKRRAAVIARDRIIAQAFD